ncbi:hypothetical protein Ciccas_013035 [Cichlidogyrus casuarinus]|uniref:Uncharacterized protein n=1 Tax=Cichlidogyrus casuarinus TaxID=1844966 RepID=A0ABD2PLN5_9PLAT
MLAIKKILKDTRLERDELLSTKQKYDRIQACDRLLTGTEEEINEVRMKYTSNNNDPEGLWLLVDSMRRQADLKQSKLDAFKREYLSLKKQKDALSHENLRLKEMIANRVSTTTPVQKSSKVLERNSPDTPTALAAPTPDRFRVNAFNLHRLTENEFEGETNSRSHLFPRNPDVQPNRNRTQNANLPVPIKRMKIRIGF